MRHERPRTYWLSVSEKEAGDPGWLLRIRRGGKDPDSGEVLFSESIRDLHEIAQELETVITVDNTYSVDPELIGNMTPQQLRIALLGVARGKSLEDSIQIGLTY